MKKILKWLLILAIFIFAAAILTNPIKREGLSLGSIGSIGSLDSSSDIMKIDNSKSISNNNNQFKYFKMLPEDNKWSQETIDAFKAKMKETQPNTVLSDENLKILQKFGSEEEAKIFIKTGKFPVNEYTMSNIKKAIDETMKDKSEEDKQKTIDSFYNYWLNKFPNSTLLFYWNLATIVNGQNPNQPENLKGQVKFITLGTKKQIPTANSPGVVGCSTDNKLMFYQEKGVGGNEVTDTSQLEKLLPGFKFLQSPCNPCSNRCPYSYEDVTLPAYAAYWGISSTSGKANPAEYMDDAKYKKCFDKANGKIIDLGGEPIECM